MLEYYQEVLGQIRVYVITIVVDYRFFLSGKRIKVTLTKIRQIDRRRYKIAL